MYRPSILLGLLTVCIASCLSTTSASVFLPYSLSKQQTMNRSFRAQESPLTNRRRSTNTSRARSSVNKALAMAIPGYGVAEQVFVGGFANFLQVYNLVITGRVLLSWFPQAQGIALLQPVFAITDPYLNLFRGLIPPIFGLDLSPLLAFFLLSVMTNATAALGSEIPPHFQQKMKSNRYKSTAFGNAANRGAHMLK